MILATLPAEELTHSIGERMSSGPFVTHTIAKSSHVIESVKPNLHHNKFREERRGEEKSTPPKCKCVCGCLSEVVCDPLTKERLICKKRRN